MTCHNGPVTTTALLPGSYDPLTNGHLDVVRRAARLYGRVVVAVVHNPEKTGTLPVDERVRVIRESVTELPGPAPTALVANLPYNVGTELFTGWLTAAWPPWWASLTLMFQKEVAERIVATTNSDHYGRLAVLAQWRSASRIAMPVHRSAFTPPPKVMTTLRLD